LVAAKRAAGARSQCVRRRKGEIMQTVILIGGGDAGGIILTEHGVRTIPPFDPAILRSLKSAAHMVQALTEARTDGIRGKLAKQATTLCNLAVEQIEQVLGPLNADRSVIFQDDSGGFTCGSTGKPPIALPWPPKEMPSVQDLITAGTIQADLVELVQKAQASKVAITDVFEKPMDVAKKLGVSLSEKSAKDLNVLAPSKLADIKDETDKEIVRFLHAAIKDGRYLQTWFGRPYEVSQSLKFGLSDNALERLVTRGAAGPYGGGPSGIVPIVIIVEIIVEVIFVAIEAFSIQSADLIVKDRSDLQKT
jgi:hypothetical protein